MQLNIMQPTTEQHYVCLRPPNQNGHRLRVRKWPWRHATMSKLPAVLITSQNKLTQSADHNWDNKLPSDAKGLCLLYVTAYILSKKLRDKIMQNYDKINHTKYMVTDYKYNLQT